MTAMSVERATGPRAIGIETSPAARQAGAMRFRLMLTLACLATLLAGCCPCGDGRSPSGQIDVNYNGAQRARSGSTFSSGTRQRVVEQTRDEPSQPSASEARREEPERVRDRTGDGNRDRDR